MAPLACRALTWQAVGGFLAIVPAGVLAYRPDSPQIPLARHSDVTSARSRSDEPMPTKTKSDAAGEATR